MSIPYQFWPNVPVHNQTYAIPSILPSSSYVCYDSFHRVASWADGSRAMVVQPGEAIRDYAEHVMSGDRRAMCSEQEKRNLEEWSKNDEYRKAIMGVIKTRLDLPWPYNYKALDILASMPVGEMVACLDKVTKLHDSAAAVEGAQHLKAAAKGIVEKANKEKARVEEEEAKKRMAAVAEMWGGLWANQPTTAQVTLGQQGFAGWPYPWRQLPPGVAAQAPPE